MKHAGGQANATKDRHTHTRGSNVPHLTVEDALSVRPLNRRGFLRLGGLAVGGLSLATLSRAQAAGVAAKSGKSAILFFLAGGPSHIDTYDMKPDAVEDIRGPFRVVDTRLPGLQVCELLPGHTRIADRFSIVRSISHNLSVHDDGTHWIQTGYPLLNARARGQTHPSQGSAVAKIRGANAPGMPPYVCIPEDYRTHMGFYEGPAYLGSRYLALNAGGDPSLGNYRPPDFVPSVGITIPRLEDRRQLLSALDRLAQHAQHERVLSELDDAQREAVMLTTGSRARAAFDLAAESQATRDRYGRHAYGQSALLARRLVEAGVTFVTINLYEKDVDWWDDHYTLEKNLRARLPRYDQALTTLVEDLSERGLLDRVLVGSFGEFGRSPRIDNNAGRGHWPAAMSALLCGGGIKGGQIIGSTTSDGGEPKDRPLKPGDLLATIYAALGIDHAASLPDRQGRPIPLLPEGTPIRELV